MLASAPWTLTGLSYHGASTNQKARICWVAVKIFPAETIFLDVKSPHVYINTTDFSSKRSHALPESGVRAIHRVQTKYAGRQHFVKTSLEPRRAVWTAKPSGIYIWRRLVTSPVFHRSFLPWFPANSGRRKSTQPAEFGFSNVDTGDGRE